MTFYICIEDEKEGESCLYERRVRVREWWGNCGPVTYPIELRIIEYRRLSCTSVKGYTKAQSGWFTPTFSDKDDKYIDTYIPLSFTEGWKRWYKHRKATKQVAKIWG